MAKKIWLQCLNGSRQFGKIGIKILGIIAALGIIFWIANTLTTYAQIAYADFLEQTAKNHFENKKYSQAEQVYKAIIQEYPQTEYEFQALGNLASLHIQSGDILSAEETIDSLTNNFDKHPELQKALYLITEDYERINKFENAKFTYQKIIDKNPNSPYASKARVGISKADIMSLVMAQKFNEAKQATDKLTVDFADNPNLPESLYWIAERYKRFERFEDAKSLYRQITENHPDSFWADKARFCTARIDTVDMILSRKYQESEESFDKLISDFAGNPDLPEALYWIARKAESLEKFKHAQTLYHKIINSCSDSAWAEKSKLSTDIINAQLLIIDEDYENAKKTIDNIVIDYADNTELPELLYWTIDRYERLDQFEDAKRGYQQIADNYPDSPYAKKATLAAAKVDAMSLIMAQNYALAENAINKMAIDFAENPDLPEALYWIAERYEWKFRFTEAKQLYEGIVNNYPASLYTKRAEICIPKAAIMSLIMEGDYTQAEKDFQKLLVDFKDHPDLADAIFYIGHVAYKKACLMEIEGNIEEEEILYKEAIKYWELLIDKFPDAKITPQTYYSLSVCYAQELEQYQKGIDYLQTLIDTWPDFKHSWHAQYVIGCYYENMRDAGILPEEIVTPKIKEAYEKVVQNYPECELVKGALLKLTELISQKNEFRR